MLRVYLSITEDDKTPLTQNKSIWKVPQRNLSKMQVYLLSAWLHVLYFILSVFYKFFNSVGYNYYNLKSTKEKIFGE